MLIKLCVLTTIKKITIPAIKSSQKTSISLNNFYDNNSEW